AFGVHGAHPANVAGEVTLPYEVSERLLIQGRREDVDCVAHGAKGGDDSVWQQEIADAQRRKAHLAEGADIDDATVAVEPLQRRDGFTAEAVFAVVIVLDDPSVGALRPIQQLKAAARAQSHSQGIL